MINKVILIGNVGADPEVRTLESGVKVTRLRIATTERFRNRVTQQFTEHTEWHTVVLWRNLADLADKWVRKGDKIYIEGSLRSNEWTDLQGSKRVSVEVVANEAKLLGRRSDNQTGEHTVTPTDTERQPFGAAQNQTPAQGLTDLSAPASATAQEMDDLPF